VAASSSASIAACYRRALGPSLGILRTFHHDPKPKPMYLQSAHTLFSLATATQCPLRRAAAPPTQRAGHPRSAWRKHESPLVHSVAPLTLTQDTEYKSRTFFCGGGGRAVPAAASCSASIAARRSPAERSASARAASGASGSPSASAARVSALAANAGVSGLKAMRAAPAASTSSARSCSIRRKVNLIPHPCFHKEFTCK